MTKKKAKKKNSVFLIIAFCAVVCYFFVSLFGIRAQIADKKAEIESLERQIAVRKSENETLSQFLAEGDLNAFVEKRARDEDLGYVYPDERVYYDMNVGQ